MANIMINKVCNLKCPYCFANKFVNKESCEDKNNISIENFKKALSFITFNACEPQHIGIIGGEPTLHPHFEELLQIAINSDKIKEVCLFTNGIHLDKCKEAMKSEKFGFLLNLNSPEDIGQERYDKIIENLKYFSKTYDKNKISIGVNIYDEHKDYSYIIKVAKEMGLFKIRMSIVVPNTKDKRNESPKEYFLRMKSKVFSFFKECRENGIIPYYDCNVMPCCFWDDEEIEWIKDYLEEFNKKYNYHSNLLNLPRCLPVIDILPDLKAVRCFGCSSSSSSSVSINDLLDMEDLVNYFEKNIDFIALNTPMYEECCKCYDYYTLRCNGGCIAFKQGRMTKLSNIIKAFNQ